MCVSPLKAQESGEEKTETEFQKVIGEIASDLSSDSKITLPEPRLAYVNISGISSMPSRKGTDAQAWIEVADGEGHYFKKRIIVDAQGSSSLGYPKRNFAVDFCEDEWVGDETTDIAIGDWVKQDSFHFKAYYTDYFRGIGAVGYQVYAEMIADEGFPWKRAGSGLSKPDAKARCFPDGFPCIVYLNGNFYGIYAWQLKKHRANMNLSKSVATHIHLDGIFGDGDLWRGHVNWSAFEVRNPKNLYTMDGNPYDGDNPAELIDESSSEWQVEGESSKTVTRKETTAKTKKAIMKLSGYHAELQALLDGGAGEAEMRARIEEYFDVPSLIDYLVFDLVFANYDGFWKNWQWFTYDGVKWFVAPYDLDGIAGAIYTGEFIIPADHNGEHYSYDHKRIEGPLLWIQRYYADEIKARYCALRDNRTLTRWNIMHKVEKWVGRIGDEFFNKEWAKWNVSPCNRDLIVNDGWEFVEGWEGYFAASEYDATATYQPGDICTYHLLMWRATSEHTGVKPASQVGHRDNLERLVDWLDERLRLQDARFGYELTAIAPPTAIGARSNAAAAEVWSIDGRRLSAPQRGVNIVRLEDGTVRKILVK